MTGEISNFIYLTIVNLDPDTGEITDIVNVPVSEVDVAKMRDLPAAEFQTWDREQRNRAWEQIAEGASVEEAIAAAQISPTVN